jgi:hypothetical protein
MRTDETVSPINKTLIPIVKHRHVFGHQKYNPEVPQGVHYISKLILKLRLLIIHPGGKNINSIKIMPTKKRITAPGAIAHILARGIDGRDIFSDDADRSYFLELFAAGLSKTGYHCCGWVLMNNHYHLIVRTSEQPLNCLMRVLNAL